MATSSSSNCFTLDTEELRVGVAAVELAAQLCEAVRVDKILPALTTRQNDSDRSNSNNNNNETSSSTPTTSSSTMTKDDQSPVTIADYGSQALICRALRRAFANDPVVAEEDAQELRRQQKEQRDSTTTTENQLDAIVQYVRQRILQEDSGTDNDDDHPSLPEHVLDWIDHGNGQADGEGRFWTLDPIDGTKGFIRGDQYAICLALVEQGVVQLGIMACPCLSLRNNSNDDDSTTVGHLFVAQRGRGAWRRPLSTKTTTTSTSNNTAFVPARDPTSQSTTTPTPHYTLIQSFEATHGNHSEQEAMAQTALVHVHNVIRMDSQAKYAMVATGKADLYLRLSRVKRKHENIWDHAAGVVLVEEATRQPGQEEDNGVVKVTDRNGRPLDFGTGTAKLLRNEGVVVCGSREVQDKILKALKQQQE